MILLDTNYLIRTLVPDSLEAERVLAWYQSGIQLCTSSIAWYEFLCGPVDDEGILIIQSIVSELILPFTADQADEASRFFNAIGRKRTLRVDAMIAATAIMANAELATDNVSDFEHFLKWGLKLV